MEERLQKIIAARGLTSRRKAEEWIAAGRVYVNGHMARLGETADPAVDAIELDGIPLCKAPKSVYIMLNKPRGFVTTLSDEQGRRTAAELVAGCGERVFPVGRLDMASEGLLLFTNDGALANALMHPSHRVDKVYLAWVTGYRPGAEQALLEPMEMDGHEIAKPEVRVRRETGETAQLELTIHEGRNRQVRRMCEQAGLHVTRLRRIREGSLALDDLPVGKWRHLTQREVADLRKAAGIKREET